MRRSPPKCPSNLLLGKRGMRPWNVVGCPNMNETTGAQRQTQRLYDTSVRIPARTTVVHCCETSAYRNERSRGLSTVGKTPSTSIQPRHLLHHKKYLAHAPSCVQAHSPLKGTSSVFQRFTNGLPIARQATFICCSKYAMQSEKPPTCSETMLTGSAYKKTTARNEGKRSSMCSRRGRTTGGWKL